MPTGTKLLIAFAATIAAVAACESSTDTSTSLSSYAGFMTGGKEKPAATTSTATGQALVVVNEAGTLSFSVTWAGLTGAITGAHIHGPADSLSAAGILINFQALPAGSTQPVATVTTATGSASGNVDVKPTAVITATVNGDSLMKLLNAGLLYANVHTAANGGGEIRAQLIKQ